MMTSIRQFAGLLWMALAPITIFYLLATAIDQISQKPSLDTKIQWIVFVIIFIPIAIGLAIFGYYAWKGEYDKLNDNSFND